MLDSEIKHFTQRFKDSDAKASKIHFSEKLDTVYENAANNLNGNAPNREKTRTGTNKNSKSMKKYVNTSDFKCTDEDLRKSIIAIDNEAKEDVHSIITSRCSSEIFDLS